MIRHTTLLRNCIPALAALLFASPSMANDTDDSADRHAVAQFASCAKPMYPHAAIAAKREGTVTLSYHVGADGKVIDSKVKKSSGHTDLDESAKAAISKCTFAPGTKNGKPVKSWMNMQYVWTLK